MACLHVIREIPTTTRVSVGFLLFYIYIDSRICYVPTHVLVAVEGVRVSKGIFQKFVLSVRWNRVYTKCVSQENSPFESCAVRM